MTPEERIALEERFWSKVDRGEPNECWEWNRSRHVKYNYGQFRWINPETGRRQLIHASRAAFWLTYGYFPAMVCHTCDNPPCCNPLCLYAGDAETNGADKATRGRAVGRARQRGESNDFAVLTDQIVVQARIRVARGETVTSVAEDLAVQRPTLAYAVTGKTWSHLDDVAPPVRQRKPKAK